MKIAIEKLEKKFRKQILINEKCPLIGIKLKELTKKYTKLDVNIMGVIRSDKVIILKNFRDLIFNID